MSRAGRAGWCLCVGEDDREGATNDEDTAEGVALAEFCRACSNPGWSVLCRCLGRPGEAPWCQV